MGKCDDSHGHFLSGAAPAGLRAALARAKAGTGRVFWPKNLPASGRTEV
jgi:hypothetical protein